MLTVLSPIIMNPILLGKPYYGSAEVYVACESRLAYTGDAVLPNVGYHASAELSYVSINGSTTSKVIEMEPSPTLLAINSVIISLPLIVSEINVTCISYLAPLEPGSRFIASDLVQSTLQVIPTG